MNPTAEIEQLADIAKHPVWDGNLMSKEARDTLVRAGYVIQCSAGWNILTPNGVHVSVAFGLLKN